MQSTPLLLILLRHVVGLFLALATAEKLIKSGVYKRGLVIGAGVLSKTLDWSDRTTAVLFEMVACGILLKKLKKNISWRIFKYRW